MSQKEDTYITVKVHKNKCLYDGKINIIPTHFVLKKNRSIVVWHIQLLYFVAAKSGICLNRISWIL